MPNVNFNTVTSLVQDWLRSDITDNIFESSSFGVTLMGDGRMRSAEGRMGQSVRGGTKVIQPLEYAENTARGTYSGYDVVDVTPGEIITAAEYEMKNYYASISVSHDEMLQVSGDRAIANIMAVKMRNAEKSLKTEIFTDIYSGSGATNILGLNTLIDSTVAVGGIDPSTDTWWAAGEDNTAHTAANMKDSTSTSFLPALLQAGYKSASRNNMRPNLILVSQDVFDIAEIIATSYGRFTSPTSARSKRMADLGFATLDWRGIPLTVDRYINDSADPMYMVNTDYFQHYFHPDNNFKFTGWKQSTNQPHAVVGQITYTCANAISVRDAFYKWTDLNNS